MYNFKDIEKKWQDKWEKEKSFKAIDFHPTKPKYYAYMNFIMYLIRILLMTSGLNMMKSI